MTKLNKKKLLSTNAAIWAVGIFASFVLPLVSESITDGRGTFLKLLLHTLPLIAAMWMSNVLINKAISESLEP